jgi:hypothetical protein
MSLVPVPRTSVVARVLRVLMLAPPRHQSIKWDTDGRCQKAICSYCNREIGVSTTDRMSRHGPLNGRPCRGTNGNTTQPYRSPGAAATRALAGRRRRRGKR